MIYKADQDTNDVVELFCAPIDGALAALKISGPMVAGGDAFEVQFVPGARRIVYSADQEVDNRTELFTSFFGEATTLPNDGRGLGTSSSPGSATRTLP